MTGIFDQQPGMLAEALGGAARKGVPVTELALALGNPPPSIFSDWARANPLDAGATALGMFPVIGDIAGVANDIRNYAQNPDQRNWLNYALTAAGALPLVPPMLSNAKAFGRLHEMVLAGRNPNKATSQVIREGLLDPSERQTAAKFFEEMKTTRTARWKSAPLVRDPMEEAARTRATRTPTAQAASAARDEAWRVAREADQFALDRAFIYQKQYFADVIATNPEWAAPFRKRVAEYSGWKDAGHFPESEAAKAHMEAVARLAKKEGWTVRHVSESGGRASSRYLVAPDRKAQVRLSDHHLPEYDARTVGRGDRYDDNIVATSKDTVSGIMARLRALISGVDE